jgi:hypothetical protein
MIGKNPNKNKKAAFFFASPAWEADRMKKLGRKNKNPQKRIFLWVFLYLPGNDLLSQGVAPQLPSALRSLTSVFGMGTGVSFSPLSPDIFNYTNFFSLFNFFLHPQSQIAVRQAHPVSCG